MGVYLIGVHLTYRYASHRLASIHRRASSLISMHPLIGVHFIGVHLI
jgi:hypothetical protein